MTVGNQARITFNAARVQAQYGSSLDSLAGSYMAGRLGNTRGRYTAAAKSLNDLLKSNSLKNKDSNYRSQFSDLYKKIYNISDDDMDSDVDTASPQSVRTASANAGGAAQSIKSYANELKYAGELDTDAYRAQAQNFVDNYNEMVDKVGNSDNSNVLRKGVLMVNTGKVYSGSLKRAGITVGADNKLSVMDDLSKIKASDVKNAFGSMGFSDKVIEKSRQINTLSGGNGSFTTNKVNSSTTDNKTESTDKNDKVNNAKTLADLTSSVKDASTAVKSYAHGLGTEENTYKTEDFTKTAKDFVDKYNSLVDEAAKSDKSSVRQKGSALESTAKAYKYQLRRAGITVDKNNRLSLKKDMSDITENDVKYAFANGSFADKVAQKADQIRGLVSGASSMGYDNNKAATYASATGAVYNVYA